MVKHESPPQPPREDFYRAIFETSCHAMMVVAPPEWQFVAANPATVELFAAKDEAQLLSLCPWDVSPVHQPSGRLSAEEARAMLESAMRDGSHSFEWYHQGLDGREIPAMVTLTRLEWAGQNLLQATVRDLRHVERAMSALQDSQEQLHKIFNNSSNGVAFTEFESGRIVNVNHTWVRSTGIPLAQAIGKTATELDLWPSRQEHDACFAELQSKGRLREYEATLLLRGQLRQFAINVECVDLRLARHLLWEFRDITEHKQADQQIALLKHSIDVHFDAAYWMDTEGRFVYVNKEGHRALGYAFGELMGKHVTEVNRNASPEIMGHVWDRLRREGYYRSETIHRRRDGSEFPVDIITTLVRFGNLEYSCGFARDISERKRAEAERARLQAQLAHAQKMESVGRLAGGIAHDFNNMLGVILGHCELALENLEATHPLQVDITSIRSAAQRSADLTRQLLAFARKQTIAPKVLDLNQTVEGILKMVRRLIGEDIQLVWRPGQELWPVFADATQIDQILANLCVNARDAIANVGTITVETGNRVVGSGEAGAPEGTVPGEYVWFSVGDDGCGMDADTWSHVFEPFFTTKGMGKGTGLGLATVYGIVEQNRGFIDLRSEVGRGTVFTIHLPRHTGKAEQPHTETVVEPSSGQETILLVEDEAPLLEVTRRMLAGHGYKLLTARSPGEAIQMAREHQGTIDLLVTDVIMPEMSGRDLARNILSLYPQARCLFMSGYTSDVIAHQGKLEDGVLFLQKPFTAKDLLAMVSKGLATSRG
jgi:two-component system cell cycle sensor histidine kinase/response regulator CckA